MKLLPPADPAIEYYAPPFLCHAALWHHITFSDLIHRDLLCAPFKLNGGWCAALRKPVETPKPKSVRWDRDLRTIGETVVGCIVKNARGQWQAYGCWEEWQDVDLGEFKAERAAKRAVNNWVGDHR